jgi:predicted oxidoreductase
MDSSLTNRGYQARDTTVSNVAQVDAQLSVIRATRTWLQYGVFGFAVFLIVVGAVEALFGR